MELSSVNPKESSKEFGALLQYYRQRTLDPKEGGILTQARLADLANCGFSEGTLGHWETGRRPIKHQDRIILRALIKVLHEYGGVQTLDEANRLLETGLYSQLTPEEIQDINPDWLADRAEDSDPTTVIKSPVTIVLSPGAIYEWLDAVFRWSEADDHARTSWAGMFIWFLSSVGDRVTAHNLFSFLSALILWGLASWLIAPILQWPLDDPATRLRSSILFAVASVVIPFAVALLSSSDDPPDRLKETRQEKKTLFLLKLTGAAVGFNTVAIALLFVAVGLFYLGRPNWLWGGRVFVLVPLLMAYVGARRIPADRYKMYDGTLQLHPADPLFFVTFLLIGAGIGAFVYIGYDILSSKAAGTSILLALAGLALWYRQKQSPMPDPLLIFSIGTLIPFLILCLFLFISPSEETAETVRSTSHVEMALAFVYVISMTTIGVTVLVRNTPTMTLRGAIGLLSILLILLALLRFDVFWGQVVTFLVLALWVVWGRKRFREYFWVHASVGLLIITIGLSLFLIAEGIISVWASLIGYTIISTGLITWAYQPRCHSQKGA